MHADCTQTRRDQNGREMVKPSMSAAQFRRYGGPEVLEISSVPVPEPASDQVLVAVHASAVNPHDAVVRSGNLKILTGRTFPLGVGLDFAGTVAATGADVPETLVATSVWGMVSPQSGHVTGAAAQYVTVPAERVAAAPAELSMVEAASLVTTGTTALRALRDVGQVQPGQRVLIRGGAGGVGVIAVQIARAFGAHVTALAGGAQLSFLTELGAHEALDYRTVNPNALEPFDIILDTAGTGLWAFRRRLRRHGAMITTAFGSAGAMASIVSSTVFGAKRIRSFSNYPDQPLLADLTALVDTGAVRPIIDTVYSLQQITDAHRALSTSGRTGKLVLTTQSNTQDPPPP